LVEQPAPAAAKAISTPAATTVIPEPEVTRSLDSNKRPTNRDDLVDTLIADWVIMYPGRGKTPPAISFETHDKAGNRVTVYDAYKLDKFVPSSKWAHAFQLPKRCFSVKLKALAKYYFLRKLEEVNYNDFPLETRIISPKFVTDLQTVCWEFKEQSQAVTDTPPMPAVATQTKVDQSTKQSKDTESRTRRKVQKRESTGKIQTTTRI
jgi:hypothetical protein